jgi:hypothetical protein
MHREVADWNAQTLTARTEAVEPRCAVLVSACGASGRSRRSAVAWACCRWGRSTASAGSVPPNLRQTAPPEIVRHACAFTDQRPLDLDLLVRERLGLPVAHEVSDRDGKALAFRLQRTRLKPSTSAEDTGYRHVRADKALYNGCWPACGCRKNRTCC